MKYLYFLLFSFPLFSQTKPLVFKIDNLISVDSTSTCRIYTLDYHIENTSDKTVSFVLNAERLIPINSGSQSEKMYFKIFENDKAIDMTTIFTTNVKRMKISYENYEGLSLEEIEKIARQQSLEYLLLQRTKSILDNIITMPPKETRRFQAKLYWDRERYKKQGDIEYYIHEDNPHFFELAFNLMKEEFEGKLSPEEYKTISSNPAHIKGWYTSNRVEINFRE